MEFSLDREEQKDLSQTQNNKTIIGVTLYQNETDFKITTQGEEEIITSKKN